MSIPKGVGTVVVLLVVGSAATFFLTRATTSVNRTRVLGAEERNAVLKWTEPLADRLMEAFNAGDEKRFAQLLDPVVPSIERAGALRGIRAQVPTIGDYRSREVLSVERRRSRILVVAYRARFTGADALTMRIAFEEKFRNVSALVFAPAEDPATATPVSSK